MKSSFPLGIIFLLIITAGSCGRWIVGANPANTPSVNYDYFVNAVRDNYSFFAEKRVSWDSLDRHYRPLVHDSLNNDSLYAIFSTMLATLKDGHVNFYTDFDRSRNHDWYLDYPPNFNSELLLREYWGKDYQQTGSFIHTWLPDSIGYVYYGSFQGSFTGRQLNYVLNRYADAKGLIFDVRNNGGGSIKRMYTLVRRFLPERTLAGTMQYKTGPGPEDFSPLDTIWLTPTVDYAKRAEAAAKEKEKQKGKRKRKRKGKQKLKEQEKLKQKEQETATKPTIRKGAGTWSVADSTATWQQKPVALLTGRRSYSAANFFSAFMSTIPHVTLIGDRTGGGGGVPVSFELPNGWKFRLSASRTYLLDGTDIENGIEPDIYQATGPAEALEGRDAIIDRAIIHLLEEARRMEEQE